MEILTILFRLSRTEQGFGGAAVPGTHMQGIPSSHKTRQSLATTTVRSPALTKGAQLLARRRGQAMTSNKPVKDTTPPISLYWAAQLHYHVLGFMCVQGCGCIMGIHTQPWNEQGPLGMARV